MKKEYDFSNSVKNPYCKKVKRQISIRLEDETINYFKELSGENGMPYQVLINSFLTQCAKRHLCPEVKWR